MRFAWPSSLILCAALGACQKPAPPAEEPLVSDAAALYTPAVEEETALHSDLAEISNAKTLRVLVHHPGGELPRPGSPARDEMELAQALAASLGMDARFVAVDDRAALVPALREGRGDLIAAGLLAAKIEKIQVSAAVRHGEIVVAIKKGAANPWNKAGAKAGKPRPLALRAAQGGRFDEAVRKWARAHGKDVHLEPAAATLDAGDVLAQVGQGQIAAAVTLKDDLQDYLAYRDDVIAATTLDKAPIVWAVREGSSKLLQAVNAFIYEQSLENHRSFTYGGDLDEIKKRRVIRVAMFNNPASYFIYRGREVGFQYELAALIATQLGVRLEVVVPDLPDEALRLLKDKKVDLAASSLTLGEKASDAVAYSQPFMFADQVLVQPAGEAPITTLEALAGRTVHVRRGSAYFYTLVEAQKRVPALRLAIAPDDAETSELIDDVAKKTIPLTVSNSVLLGVELTARDDVQGTLKLAENQPLVYGVRKDAPRLAAWLNDFIKREYRGAAYNVLIDKYFKNARAIRQREAVLVKNDLSPYDEIVQRLANQYGFDWRLITAQMYQESRFDPAAKSWVGALGLLQVMPQTGAALGFRRLQEPETGLHAGIKYMHQLLEQFDPAIEMRHRVRFALAAYNAGLGHVLDAQVLARERGLDAGRWFENVERCMLLLEKREFYRRARHGFCRGRETVSYVSQIQTRYDAYVSALKGK